MWFGLLALFIANFIGGTFNSVAVKLGVKEIPPLTFSMLRFLLATLVILPFYLKNHKESIKNNFWHIFAQSAFFAVNIGIFSIAIQFTSAVMSQILYLFIPIIVGILSHFIFKERFTPSKIFGSLIALIGASMLIVRSIIKADILSFGTLPGNLLIIFGGFSFSGYLLLSQKLTKIYSPLTISFYTFLITAFLLLLAVPFENAIRPIIFNKITIVGVESLLIMGILSSALGYFLIQYGVKKTGAFTASLFQYLGPFFTAVSATIVLGEKVTPLLVMGGIMIAIGVFISTSFKYLKRGARYLRTFMIS